MKKCLVVLSMVLAGGVFAADAKGPADAGSAEGVTDDVLARSPEDLNKPEEVSWSPVGISFATPIQYPSQTSRVNGLRLNLIYGDNYGVNGLDIGIAGSSGYNSTGAQLNLLAGVNDYDFTGAQLSLLGNAVLGFSTGAQASLFINYDRSGITGAQFACINMDGALTGLQLGLANVTLGYSLGCQLGIYNCNRNEFHGWSFGALNFSERHEGLQMGIVNVTSVRFTGLQLGLLNSAAGSKSCLQIGLMNLNGSADYPVLPFINANF